MPELEGSENWKRLEDLFYRALELRPEQRGQFNFGEKLVLAACRRVAKNCPELDENRPLRRM